MKKTIQINKKTYKAFPTSIAKGCEGCAFKGPTLWKYCIDAEELSGLDCVTGYIWKKVKGSK